MKTKRTWMIPTLAAALLAGGCSSDNGGADDFGPGTLVFSCAASGAVTYSGTRAVQDDPDRTTIELPAAVIPASGDDFALHLTGSYTDSDGTTRSYDNSWTTVAAFHTENPSIEAGTYTAVVSYGDPEAEGPDAACFEGTAADFRVAAGTTTRQSVTARLSNACFRVVFSEWMTRYYSDISITIHTATGDFEFTPETAADKLIFVKPGQTLSISGSAVKAQTGAAVTFPKTELNDAKTVAETMHTVTVTDTQAGSGTLTITFDTAFTEVTGADVELNPEL